MGLGALQIPRVHFEAKKIASDNPLTPCQIPHTSHANSIGQDNVKLAKLVHSHMMTTQLSMYLVNTSQRYE